MTTDQTLVFAIIAIAIALFAWGRWRYDVVALFVLLISVGAGVVPADAAFSGFSNPAVITVAAVLILTRALQRAGVAEWMSSQLGRLSGQPMVQIGAMTVAVAVLSAFMNNVGALALMLPVAMHASEKHGIPVSRLMMPLAFSSLLGGLTTLIGTPPNLIIASYRAAAGGVPFAVFDYAPVGVPVALAGIAFVVLVGFRLLPTRTEADTARGKLFEIQDYVTEVRVPAGNPLVGEPLRQIIALGDGDVSVVALFRGERRLLAPPWYERLEEGDRLMIEGDPVSLKRVVDAARLKLVGDKAITSDALRSDDVVLVEAVISPGSRLDGRTARGLRINARHGVNVLAVARESRQLTDPIGHIQFQVGDVLLLQGPAETMPDTLSALHCLPLAERGLSLGAGRSVWPLMVFGVAILITGAGILPVHIAFVGAVVTIVLTNMMPLREAYDAVDWSMVVLLGAILPLGAALQATGGTDLIAGFIIDLGGRAPPMVLLAVVMAIAMLLTAVVNNAATAVLMAPVAISVANSLGTTVDPFLMAVAVGCTCAFLTPIGHQSNVLVMVPGGYRFGDYWRLGLPLSLVVLVTATPLILWIWPLHAG